MGAMSTGLARGVGIVVVPDCQLSVTVVVVDPARSRLVADGISVLAETANARDAVREIAHHQPDVLVVDLGVGELAAVCREVRRVAPNTAVLVFTDSQDDRSIMGAIRAGVRGYLPKSAAPDDLARAIRGVAGGQAIFGAHVAGKVTELLFARRPVPFPDLTPREREILGLIAAGVPNTVIAVRLSVATKTVRNYASGIFTKLGVAGRTEAMMLARNEGLG
jgi:DNA-binding NarL/FixJ family response regulator